MDGAVSHVLPDDVAPSTERPPVSDRIAELGGTNVRTRAARGTIVNAAFLIGLQMLGFLKGFIVAGFLTAQEYGVWGLLVISLGTLLWLTQIGIDDKFIQQDMPDQEKAFRLAFTLNAIVMGAFAIILLVALPLFALAYDQPKIIAPGLVLILALPTAPLTTPLWIFYRRMNYLKQRRLQMFDPLTSFVVTCALAVAGMGYWSLVIGTVAGSWAGAIVAVRASPYKLRFHFDRAQVGEWVGFSWPLLLSSGSSVLLAQIPILFAQRHLGTAAVGAVTLAGSLAVYANRVDDIISNTLYPAVCAVKDRADLLLESFTKSNRLAFMWGTACGVGVALFVGDLTHFVIGRHWDFAVPAIQIFALAAAINQFGFNWTTFYRAVGNTKPMLVGSVIMLTAVLSLCIPLMYVDGVRGYAIGMLGATVIFTLVRCYYLLKLFPGLNPLRHALRAIMPTIPATALILAIRALSSGERSGGRALAELVLYGVVVAATVLMTERTLLREVVGYLRGRPTVREAV
jgi:O-antigen/teichoic acid export membrane protein